MTTTCEWRSIPGWEGLYEVSEYGEVRSVGRVIVRSNGAKQTIRSRVLAAGTNTHGYEVYTLYRDGVGVRIASYVAVALAFIGPRPSPAHDICHADDDKSNNHYTNLRYDTKSGNMIDRVRNGIHHKSNKTHCPHGHEYAGDNLIIKKTRTGVARWCRECMRKRSREYNRRKAQEKKERERCAAPTAEDRSPTALRPTARGAGVAGKTSSGSRTTAVRRSRESR